MADIWPSPTDKPMNMVSHEFGELVAEHYKPLYKFAYSLTRAEADASDLTQQTFIYGPPRVISCANVPKRRPGSSRRCIVPIWKPGEDKPDSHIAVWTKSL